MLLSCLLRRPQYADRLRRFCPVPTRDGPIQVCSINQIQATIEEAWRQGFDPQVGQRYALYSDA